MKKTLFITGASRGIGQAIAISLSNPDARLFLHGRNQEKLAETCALVADKGGEALPIYCDLSQVRQVLAMAQDIDCDQLDVLIHNAGIVLVKPVESIDLDEWQQIFDVNVTTAFLLSKTFLSKMPSGASIVTILSTAAKTSISNWTAYCMSKFALDGFTRSLREELRSRSIRVINVYPAATATDIWSSVPGEWDKRKMMRPENVAQAVKAALDQSSDILVEDITLGSIIGQL